MSDAGSGSRFPFLKRNRNDDTPSDFSQRMDLNSPVTCPHPPKAWTKTPNANMLWR